MELTIRSRVQWNARNPRRVPDSMSTPSKRLWLHHTANNSWHGGLGVRQCQNFHMDSRDYNDIAYSFLVDNTDGGIYMGRGPGIVGAHTEGDNSFSHAICAMGDFTTAEPSTALISSIASLVYYGWKKGWWPKQITGGHRDAPGAQTACPGNKLYSRIDEINALVLALDNEGDDWLMAVGDDILAELKKTNDLLSQMNHQLSGDARLKAIAADVDRIADKIVKPD